MNRREPDASEPVDHYRALGVNRDATDADITRAYRRLARTHHPDSNPTADAETFADLTDAYDVLRDPDRRRRYDQTSDRGHARRPGPTRIPVRNKGRHASRTRLPLEVQLSFEQAALGSISSLEIVDEHACPACAGTGIEAGAGSCSACAGQGTTARNSGGITIRNVCPRCHGTGARPSSCPRCAGSGTTAETRRLNVQIPAGVTDGERHRVPIVGDDRRTVDVIVRVSQHDHLIRNGNDITTRLPITLAEAALGAVVTVPTLEGTKRVRIPAGSRDGRVLRLRNHGMPHPGGRGDLLITLTIDVPPQLNDRQQAALHAYAAATDCPRPHPA